MRGISLFRRRKAGQYLVHFVMILPGLMLLMGLVIDGGWMYWQYRRAWNTVNLAAQTASHAIDEEHFRATNQVVLDPAEARQVALRYVNLNKHPGFRLTGIQVAPRWVAVSGEVTIPTFFLRLVGINELTMKAQGRAYPAYGIEREGD